MKAKDLIVCSDPEGKYPIERDEETGNYKVKFAKEGEVIKSGSQVTVVLYVKNEDIVDFVVEELSHPNPDVTLKMDKVVPAGKIVKLIATWTPDVLSRDPLRDGIHIVGYYDVKP